MQSSSKAAIFATLAPEIGRAVKSAPDLDSAYRSVVKLMAARVPHFNWTGIYLLEGDTLVLHNFVGRPTEHTHIPVGRGVCGAAVAEKRNIIVEDVTKHENYLACSLETRSEIVVLIKDGAKIIGQIDVDSDTVGAFDAEDERFLGLVARLLAERA
ncbi:GAF domain-containing protein [bacterium]|nr:GAF domain-containing protein [bacterium]